MIEVARDGLYLIEDVRMVHEMCFIPGRKLKQEVRRFISSQGVWENSIVYLLNYLFIQFIY